MGYQVIQKDGYYVIQNDDGKTLSMAGLDLIEQDGVAFKNLAKQDKLLPYEDWRLDSKIRAVDLAKRLSIAQIAGLMLYSSHQMVPCFSGGPFPGHYDGKPFEQSGKQAWDLTDEQHAFLTQDAVRHVLLMVVKDPEVSAKWSNQLQAVAEQQPFGIPVNISSDPRHGASSVGAEFKSAASDVSKWPEGIGMAATGSAEVVRTFAKIAAKEYRAMGITTALGPQIDLSTEPRWMRLEDTFGADVEQVIAFTKAYCDGMQTTEGEADGWGKDSVVTMVKHWPGGGTGEGGRDAHYPFGAYAVYPGGQFETHLKPFTEGAFQLDGATKKAGAVMPYYTVSYDQDTKYGENVGNSYSRYIIHDLLREQYQYDGVVCTDWGITADPLPEMDSFSSRCYGVAHLSEAERHLQIILNGVDQFGGNNRPEPILEAYQIGCERHGEAFMRARMEASAVRLLTGIFRLGLFEDPYLDAEQSKHVVGCDAFVEAGLQAQRQSVVLLKNKAVLPLQSGSSVYVPNRTIAARKNFFRGMDDEKTVVPLTQQELDEYGRLVQDPKDADVAVVFVESPLSDGYSGEKEKQQGNGYQPISLQYRPYRADCARAQSIAGGDVREEHVNRSYQNEMGTAANEADLDLILATKKQMGEKPVIVCMRMHNPTVMAELEPTADGIVVDFGVEKKVLLEVLFGKTNPTAKLPFLLPKNMQTVEQHLEDVIGDMQAYTDTQGFVYQQGFGLNYQ